MKKALLGELIGEAVAMCMIITIGDSVAAMYSLYDPSPYKQAYWGLCITWGLAVTLAIYSTASVSGCHANPAVTLALACFREFPWQKVGPYCLAQVLGAFTGAVIVYALFVPVIDAFNAAHNLTRATGGAAGVFFTHPGNFVLPRHAFTDEIILTAFLVFGIFAITEQYNEQAPGADSGALIIGFLIAAIGASTGFLESWAINPARDSARACFASLPAGVPRPFRRRTTTGGFQWSRRCWAVLLAAEPTSFSSTSSCRRATGLAWYARWTTPEEHTATGCLRPDARPCAGIFEVPYRTHEGTRTVEHATFRPSPPHPRKRLLHETLRHAPRLRPRFPACQRRLRFARPRPECTARTGRCEGRTAHPAGTCKLHVS